MSLRDADLAFPSADRVDVGELEALVGSVTDPADHPHAAEIVSEVVIYDASTLTAAAATPDGRRAVLAELAGVLRDGSGALVVRGGVDSDAVARATVLFDALVAEQHAAGRAVGDHFAAPGTNDRVWNVHEKLALRDPDTFVDYYRSDAIALASEAWLGPAYQITAQVNLVRPGGVEQSPHRDYHLGFMSDEQAHAFPVHAHLLSPYLTLQGAVAHGDMPVESGPTMLLPHSQKLAYGYVAWRRPDVIELFRRHHVQLPLAHGDTLFFNPALLHGAGTNRTADVQRMGNLLQVSSAMGRAMETVDRTRIVRSVYAALAARRAAGWPERAVENVVAAAAEGYSFPTNLDRDPPVGGLAPASQADLVRAALAGGWTGAQLGAALDALDERRRSW